MGSFSGANWSGVTTAAWLCLGGTVLSWLLSKPIAAYALGEGYAQSLGINVKVFRAATDYPLQPALRLCYRLCGPHLLCRHRGATHHPHHAEDLQADTGDPSDLPLRGGVLYFFAISSPAPPFLPREMAIGTDCTDHA